MPGVSNERSVAPAADDSQSNDGPSSSECDERSPVAISTPSETANHDAQRLQVLHDHTLAGDSVNLADVDHIQTVITAQPPASSYDYPGLCPICGDKISGIYQCFLCILLMFETNTLQFFAQTASFSVHVHNNV